MSLSELMDELAKVKRERNTFRDGYYAAQAEVKRLTELVQHFRDPAEAPARPGTLADDVEAFCGRVKEMVETKPATGCEGCKHDASHLVVRGERVWAKACEHCTRRLSDRWEAAR